MVSEFIQTSPAPISNTESQLQVLRDIVSTCSNGVAAIRIRLRSVIIEREVGNSEGKLSEKDRGKPQCELIQNITSLCQEAESLRKQIETLHHQIEL